MSDLLKKLAQAFEVNHKTVSRWCAAGIIPSAERRGDRGKWRTRWPLGEAELLQAVAGRLRKHASGEGRRLRSRPDGEVKELSAAYHKMTRRIQEIAAANYEKLLGGYAAKILQLNGISLTDLHGPGRRTLTKSERERLNSPKSSLRKASKTIRILHRKNPLVMTLLAAAQSCELDEVLPTDENIMTRLKLLGVSEAEMRQARADASGLRGAVRKAARRPVRDTTENVLHEYAERALIAASAKVNTRHQF